MVTVDTPTGAVTLLAVIGVAMLETPTGIVMADTPTFPPTVAFVAISNTTLLTTAVEKNAAPVSKKLPIAFAVKELTATGPEMLLTPNGIVAADTRTVPVLTPTGMEMLDTPNGIEALVTPAVLAVTGVEMLETPKGIVAAETATTPVEIPSGIVTVDTLTLFLTKPTVCDDKYV
jgi:hypothetical protein